MGDGDYRAREIGGEQRPWKRAPGMLVRRVLPNNSLTLGPDFIKNPRLSLLSRPNETHGSGFSAIPRVSLCISWPPVTLPLCQTGWKKLISSVHPRTITRSTSWLPPRVETTSRLDLELAAKAFVNLIL